MSGKNYVAKFDEFYIRCRDLSTESDIQIVSRFINGLRHDLRIELRTRRNMKLERAYIIVQELDTPKIVHAPRSPVYEIPTPKYDHLLIQKSNDKSNDRDFTKLSPIIKCFKCQGY